MGRNYMPEVAKMLGVEIGEEFDVLDEDGEIRDCGPYKFTNETIVNRLGHEASGWLLFCLLAGKYTLQKRPWRPKDGESYYYIHSTDGFISRSTFCSVNADDLAMLSVGNCFPTMEDMLAAKPEMLEKFEEIKKGVRE